MTSLSDMAQTTKAIVDVAGDDYGAMSLSQLGQIATAMKVCALAQGASLVERCGDVEVAHREIARAMDLPASVLLRRYQEAAKVITLDGLPSIAQHAAIIARTMATVRTLDAEIATRARAN